MKKRKKYRSITDDIIIFLQTATVLFTFWIYYKTESIYLTVLPFVGILTILYGIIRLRKHLKIKKYLNCGLDDIDGLSGISFEDFLQVHFERQGYKVKTTAVMGDYGADLVLKKDKEKIVVQAKRWKNQVGIKAVQEAIGSIKMYKANRGMVITNNTFSEGATTLAKANDIEMWDRKKLIEFIKKSHVKKDYNDKEYKNAESQIEQICPKCNCHLALRNGPRGKFWGCSAYPKCRYTRDS